METLNNPVKISIVNGLFTFTPIDPNVSHLKFQAQGHNLDDKEVQGALLQANFMNAAAVLASFNGLGKDEIGFLKDILLRMVGVQYDTMKELHVQFEAPTVESKPIPGFDLDSYVPKGDIEGFPKEVVAKMLERQAQQGNEEDVTVFEENRTSSRSLMGFDWGQTFEGLNFWGSVINDKFFDEFFKEYPKAN